jgi:ribulose-5-phosphate 4-epimerase/fuculose-1-phosphate aldolase
VEFPDLRDLPDVSDLADLVAGEDFLPLLSPHQEFAVLARALHREGYNDRMNGHITIKLADGTLLTNPYGLTWEEVRASDIIRIDADGRQLDGSWFVNPAIRLHLALHKNRPDVNVTIHNHPEYSTLWATVGQIPPAYEQVGALARESEIVVIHEFEKGVGDDGAAIDAACGMGSAWIGLLAHHGVFILGDTIGRAFFRSVCIEVRARYAWKMLPFRGAPPMPADGQKYLANAIWDGLGGQPAFWQAAARREIRLDPSVLT